MAFITLAAGSLEFFDTGGLASLSAAPNRQLRDGFDAVIDIATRHDEQFVPLANAMTAALFPRVMRRRGASA